MIEYFKKKFVGLFFFYSYLGNKTFYGVLLSILVGLLDGFGITMFLPLLQMADNAATFDSTQLGKLSFLIDLLRENDIPITVITVLLVMIFFFLVKGVVSFFQFYYRVRLQESFLKRLRLEFIQDVSSVSYEYFLKSESGRIQNILTTEVERVTKAYQAFFLIMQNLIMVVVYMLFAFSVNTQFAILVTIGGLLTSLVYRGIYKSTKSISRLLSGGLGDLQGLIFQLIQNFKYLKATHRIVGYSKAIETAAVGIEDNNKKVGVLMAILNASREPLVIAVVAAVIYLQTSVFGSSLAPILISLLFFYRALSFLMQMQSHSNYYLSVSGAIDNMIEFKQILNSNSEKSGTAVFDSFKKDMTVKNGCLSIDDKDILRNVNLTIHKNETVAIVGESGSGKTTLMNVLTGIMHLNKGEFTIDGKSFEQYDKKSFRDRIGYITQDPVIFTDTVFNNISFWEEKNDCNTSRFKEATELAACSHFVVALPDNEDTVLGLNGINLSGGQRQRIAIARELYRKVDVLLLDEATSSLDSETESEIMENIDSLRGHYTIIIITHRLSTIKNADRVVLMKNGTIDAIGTFQQLLSESETFERMVSIQELKKIESGL